jgi:hypothetical protein
MTFREYALYTEVGRMANTIGISRKPVSEKDIAENPANCTPSQIVFRIKTILRAQRLLDMLPKTPRETWTDAEKESAMITEKKMERFSKKYPVYTKYWKNA